MGPVVVKKKKIKIAQLCFLYLEYVIMVTGRTWKRFCKGFMHVRASVCVCMRVFIRLCVCTRG